MTSATDSLITALLGLISVLQSAALALPPSSVVVTATSQEHMELSIDADAVATSEIRDVPFYSQFTDISDPSWKKVGCGVASLAMLIDYYEPAVPVDTLLKEGIAAGAYLSDAGWKHAGLINLSKKYGLDGESYDMAGLTMDAAFTKLQHAVEQGPVMASIYYTFTPGNPIPHLVVINSIHDGIVYYNDPAEPSGGGTISTTDFKPAWKKRYIEIRPTETLL